MGGAKFATKNENNSAGFNLGWDVCRQLWARFDFHAPPPNRVPTVRTARTPCSVWPASCGTTTVDWSKDFPVLRWLCQRGRRASTPEDDGDRLELRNSYMKMEIQQAQLNGHFNFF
jgi:hypothetical protein